MPNYNLPSTAVRESDKNEQYHRSFVDSIISGSLGSTTATEFQVMDSCYKYFDNASNPKDFSYLQQAPDGSVLPAQWNPINKIFPKVMVLLGELVERGYDFQVTAINKEAKSRKLDAKEEARVALRLRPTLTELDQYAGHQAYQPPLPESEEELDEFFDKNYKEIAEIVMYYALKYLDKKNGWDYERFALFRDLLIAGKCVIRHRIENGIPVAKRVDPRFFLYDTYSSDDFASDSSYFGEVEYMPLAQAAEEFQLNMKELQGAHEKYQEYLRVQQAKSSSPQRNIELSCYDSLNSASGLQWFKDSPSGLRVLVTRVYWMDQKKNKIKESEDNYGGIHAKRMKPDSQEREGVTSRLFKVWRQATVIGGKFMKNWGLMENMARDTDPEKIAECPPPYTVLLPNFVNGRTVSPVERAKGLQNFKDIITYNMELVVARAGSRGFVYDVAQCPDEWNVDTVIKYLKTVGIAFINSKQGGTPAQFNQFQQFDLSLSTSIDQYLNLSRWIDEEMNSVFGVNEARQGEVQGASQAVGVTRSALLQSSLTTAPYFKLFEMFSSKVWDYQAKLVKLAWAGKERFAPIIGDAGVDFLKEDVDLDLNDYGVFVETSPRLLDDINTFHQLVMAALSAGQLSFNNALQLLREKDVMEGVRKFDKITKQQEAQARQQELQLMAAQEKARQETQAQMAQFQNQQADMAAKRAVATESVKAQANKESQLIDLRGDLIKEKLKLDGGATKTPTK